GHNFTPGNGLFLTSQMSTGMAGYDYTGIRRWGLGVYVSYNRGKGYWPTPGIYKTSNTGLSATRSLTRGLHFSLNAAARRYSSPTHGNYNRMVYEITSGLTFAPGDAPLRLW